MRLLFACHTYYITTSHSFRGIKKVSPDCLPGLVILIWSRVEGFQCVFRWLISSADEIHSRGHLDIVREKLFQLIKRSIDLGGFSVALSLRVYLHNQLPTAWDLRFCRRKKTSPTFYLFQTFSLFFKAIFGGSLHRNIWRSFNRFSSSAWLGASASRHENKRVTTKVRATEKGRGGKVSEPPLL
ncbi:unnamed protein product [Arctogadus glacialis]